jgi:hypothetical protein
LARIAQNPLKTQHGFSANVQGLACLAKVLARHRQACPIMKTKGFLGLGNRKIINPRRETHSNIEVFTNTAYLFLGFFSPSAIVPFHIILGIQ